MEMIARRIRIRGVVQGVGFRPFVFRLAQRYGVRGWVLNGDAGVEILAEADAGALDEFLGALRAEAPPAARISEIMVEAAPCGDHATFEIRASLSAAAPTVRISPDLAICDDCTRELRAADDRRRGYVYINCTNCGPRYSIIQRLPYDRAHTTMSAWPLCGACRDQYDDPRDRRFHAQPVACEACGPTCRLIECAGGTPPGAANASGPQAVRRTAELLRKGAIVAIKGVGGYHLACDARRPDAVRLLRERKFRKEKAFAIMACDLAEAAALVELSAAHAALLTGAARPIVLARRRVELAGVAPDTDQLGVMLPYAPLHHLLFDAGAPHPLVLTSGNRSNEPIAYRDDDALERLSGIADAFLTGERPIARRIDDSVVTVRDGRPFVIRRARGLAPLPVAALPADEPILALGADLKNALTLVVRGEAIVSQHIGDLDEYETQRAFEQTVADLLDMYEIDRNRLTVAHDLHPEFFSTRFAQRLNAKRRIAVQHHRAHVASVAAEHGRLDQPLIGVALDGTGYGDNHGIWGCEIVTGSVRGGLVRRAWLRPVQMPGGDAAARFPVQAAAAFLQELDEAPDFSKPPFEFPPRFRDACRLIERNVRCFKSTSMGRLFDAVAALVGFTREISYEGQAAMWLEHRAALSQGDAPPYPFDGCDPRAMLREIIADRRRGEPIERIAARFHAGLADGLSRRVTEMEEAREGAIVALSGGVMQNELLVARLSSRLSAAGLRVITNSAVPVNDGGIGLGQAALAACSA
ncbi:Carbamoyltransferase HypF [Phycisphaerae bacterium RAS1]|nr:Carbamoyltransferase HypF [Phycisphaerae bacterium RAS1]